MNNDGLESSIIQDVLDAKTDDFLELARLALLDIQHDFVGADLSNAKFEYSDLSDCDFHNAYFDSAHFFSVNFANANLENCDFGHASLQFVDFSNANLKNAKLITAYLDRPKNYSREQLLESDLSKEQLDQLEETWKAREAEWEHRMQRIRKSVDQIKDILETHPELDVMLPELDHQLRTMFELIIMRFQINREDIQRPTIIQSVSVQIKKDESQLDESRRIDKRNE